MTYNPGVYSSVSQVQEWYGKYVDMILIGNIEVKNAFISDIKPIPGGTDAEVTYIQYPYGRAPIVSHTTASAITVIGQATPLIGDGGSKQKPNYPNYPNSTVTYRNKRTK